MNKKAQAISMEGAPKLVLVLVLLIIITGAGALAVSSFKSTLTSGTAAYNATANGETGVLNLSAQYPTVGTIIGISLIIVVVLGAFYFVFMRGGGL